MKQIILLFVLIAALVGCASRKTTNPPMTKSVWRDGAPLLLHIESVIPVQTNRQVATLWVSNTVAEQQYVLLISAFVTSPTNFTPYLLFKGSNEPVRITRNMTNIISRRFYSAREVEGSEFIGPPDRDNFALESELPPPPCTNCVPGTNGPPMPTLTKKKR